MVSSDQMGCEDGKHVGKELRLDFFFLRASIFVLDGGLLIKESLKFSLL